MTDQSPCPDSTRYRAFISYAHEDQRWAQWLLGAIESYRIPGDIELPIGWQEARIRPVFLDRAELSSAGHLDDMLRESLTSSDALLVICSPAAVASIRVQQEIRTFAALGRGSRIFPVMVGGHPIAAQRGYPAEQECLPIALRELHECPLAAELRSGKGTKREARLRLVASILGVRYDALERRDDRRRVRRQWSIVAAALAVSILTSGLGVYAWRAKVEGDRQRIRSEQTVEFLKELLQGADPNKALGRELSARDLVDQGAERLANAKLDPLLRSDMQFLLSNVYYALGTSDQAQVQLDAALKARSQLAKGSEAHAEALEWSAMFALDAGRAADAVKAQREVVAMLEKLGDQELILDARSFLGDILVSAGSFEEGAGLLDATLNEQLRIGAGEVTVARTYNRLGLALQEHGDPAAAIGHFEHSLALQRKLFGAVHPEVATVLNNLAIANKLAGRIDTAKGLYREAITMRRKLYGEDHPLVARVLGNLAALQRDSGDPQAALKTFQQARVVLEKVNGPRHPDVATNLYNTGITFFRMNRYADAVPFFTQAAEQRAEFHGARHWRTAQSIGFRGQAFMNLGRDREALADLDAASAMFAEYYGPGNIETLFMRAWLAEAHLLGRRYARAHEDFGAILRTAEAVEKRDASLCGSLQVSLAETSLRLGNLQEARDWLARARKDVSPQDRRYPLMLNLEAQVHPQGMQSPEARALLKGSFEAASKQTSFPAMMLDRMRRN